MKIAFTFNLRRDASSLEEAEFDTPDTIDAIASALASEGDQVIPIEMTRDGTWIQRLTTEKPDLIFNTAEGFAGIGRESLAPIVFEQLKIPYVGCGPYGCFLTLDKFLTKQVVSSRGVPCPEGYYLSDQRELETVSKEMPYPVFVKPNFEGSSKGITERSLCENQQAFLDYAKESLQAFPEGILVERFIEGKDVTLPFITGLGEDGVLSPIEYTGPKRGNNWIYDYELKNELDDRVGVLCPADIPAEAVQKLQGYMKGIIQALGAVDMGRADFRVTPAGDVYFIEFNALPSLQPGAGIFEATKKLGLSYNETIQKIVSAAIDRCRIRRTRIRPTRKLSTRDPKIALVYNLKRKKHEDPGYEQEAEFDSQSTIDAIVGGISGLGHNIVPIEATKSLAAELLQKEIDLVFNIAEGLNHRGREAQVPALCDLLGIEHTGSDATCLAVTLDKGMTTRLIASEGIHAPRSKTFVRIPKKLKLELQYPLIVKPNVEGTSKGVYDNSVVQDESELVLAMQRLKDVGIQNILVEEYITGREFTIGVLGDTNPLVIGPTEIAFKRGDYPVYSFEAKQLDDQLDNEHFKMICPAELTEKQLKQVKNFAKKCFRVVGARDVARIDFRMTAEGKLYFIEINPLPGLSPGYSDLTIMADRFGISYPSLLEIILSPGLRRWRRKERRRQEEVSPEL